ncbi:hypothetical protein QFC21_003636 [Naganishia friedmannii]|uniref:Uncharacterized protein n=1 Tax=Naganishia friedmannii TaxID=89922 RepID=A0ACC2VPZ8_9TREE|nr:hypothetical protein QFC21_003636 [Naganishia friedmannii]
METVQYLVTSITRNFPSFVKEPLTGLIGKTCYDSLIYNFDLSDTGCVKYSISKGLGLGIVVGGSIVKLPQIGKILNSKSARGLSLSAYVLETASYAITLAYAYRNDFPFSTYGENLFLSVQNVVITLLIIWFAPTAQKILSGSGGRVRTHGNVTGVLGGLALTAIVAIFLSSRKLCSPGTLSLLQASTVPLALISKAPQIISNNRLQSTGNLSAFAVFNAFAGCLARLFTTSQETGDSLVWWGFALAAALNAVLAGQMIMYWNNNDEFKSRPLTDTILGEKRGQNESGRKVE